MRYQDKAIEVGTCDWGIISSEEYYEQVRVQLKDTGVDFESPPNMTQEGKYKISNNFNLYNI